jgi:hypothetical protein
VEPRPCHLRARACRSDLVRLAAQGLSDSAIARELSRLYAPLVFTRFQVWYYRHEDDRIAQDGECVPRERGSSLHRRRAIHQLRRGFGHLLPLPLRCRESDILALLKERGPLTQQQIREAVGVRSLHTMGQRWLARLFRLGLIEVVGCVAYTSRGRRRLFGIAARALPPAEHRPLSNRPVDLEPLRIACG